jgi:hypothetical protein
MRTSGVDGGWKDQPCVGGPGNTEETNRGVTGMPSPLPCSRSAEGPAASVTPPERQRCDRIGEADLSDERPHSILIEASIVAGGTQVAQP